jgi:hypothetical protein
MFRSKRGFEIGRRPLVRTWSTVGAENKKDTGNVGFCEVALTRMYEHDNRQVDTRLAEPLGGRM